MPRNSLVLLLAAAGCGAGAPDAAAPDNPAVGQVEVTGTVMDSLLGSPVAGVRLAGGTNGAFAVTGQDGSYRMLVNREPSTIRVRDFRYQPYSVANPFTGNQQIILRLIRLAPAVVRCALEGSSAEALVVDLQGRKTVDRRMNSHAVATTASGSSGSLGHDWFWYPLDNFTWAVQIPLPAGTTSLAVTVVDADLNSATRACDDASVGGPLS